MKAQTSLDSNIKVENQAKNDSKPKPVNLFSQMMKGKFNKFNQNQSIFDDEEEDMVPKTLTDD